MGDPASVHGLVLDVANDLVQSQAERYLFSPKDGSIEDVMSWLGVTFPVSVSEEELRPLMGTPGLAGDLVYKRVAEAYEAKCAGEDQEMLPFMERGVFLQVIDREWQDYLRAMDDLRQGVNLRAYGQRDPLIEYKKEAFSMFETLIATIKTKVVSAEFRSATAARMQRMLAAAGVAKIRTNADEITVTDSEREGRREAAEGAPKAAPSGSKTIGDVFASMMSRPPAAVPNGPAQMPGATAAAIDADGWLHTGDLACRTPEGNYRITGRLKDMIIRGGENIYPKEIEEFIYTHPKVSDVQVIGVPDEAMGEEIMACIILKEGESMSVDEMRQYVLDHMAKHKVPKYIEFVDGFPMNDAGKIQKYKMREQAIAKLGLQKAASVETA
jgi:acyl-CoA synthetase (AMP-forming)/AMP-acid ligase II